MSINIDAIKQFIKTPVKSNIPKIKTMDKIYDLTGRASYENIHIMANANRGRELIISCINIKGVEIGDTLLIDRPHYKSVPFKIMDLKYLPENPDAVVAHVAFIDEHIGGYKGALRLRFKKNLARE